MSGRQTGQRFASLVSLVFLVSLIRLQGGYDARTLSRWEGFAQPLVESSLVNEKLLEDMIVLDPRILSSESELIGIGIIGDPPISDWQRYRQSSSG
jgi:hypothetical protein